MKFCTCCKKTKPLSAFHKVKARKDGRHPHCKVCRSNEASKRYQKDKEKLKARCKKTRDKDTGRTKRLNCRQYGITPDDWNQMFQEQGGRCAICGKPQSESSTTFDIDHDHVTGRVRGLLCRKCNVGLGCFGDDEDLLRLASEYLENKS